MSAQSDYTAKNITVLEGLEPVRRRPGMYIGGTGVEGEEPQPKRKDNENAGFGVGRSRGCCGASRVTISDGSMGRGSNRFW